MTRIRYVALSSPWRRHFTGRGPVDQQPTLVKASGWNRTARLAARSLDWTTSPTGWTTEFAVSSRDPPCSHYARSVRCGA